MQHAVSLRHDQCSPGLHSGKQLWKWQAGGEEAVFILAEVISSTYEMLKCVITSS